MKDGATFPAPSAVRDRERYPVVPNFTRNRLWHRGYVLQRKRDAGVRLEQPVEIPPQGASALEYGLAEFPEAGSVCSEEFVEDREDVEAVPLVHPLQFLHDVADGAGPVPRPRIEDLDDLPLPAYHLVDMEAYFRLDKQGYNGRPVGHGKGSKHAVSDISSRGYPFDCVFCSIHLPMGRKWRAHSVEYVGRHIEYLISKYGVRHIHFEDDNISANVKRFKGLLEALQNLGNVFSWDPPNGVRVDTLSKEILRDCKRSGCVYLVFGVESGNQSVLDRIVGKKLDLDTVTKAAAWCREISLDAMSFFVIGFPGETRRDMKDTADFALRLQREYDVNPGHFVATPLPGTRLERICIEKGLLEREPSPDLLAKITRGAEVLDGDTFSAKDVREMRDKFLKGYKRNVATNLAAFFARNPGAVSVFTREVFTGCRNGSLKDALLSAYLIKNSLTRRR